MRNSKEFKDWQNDLILLGHTYNINTANNRNEPLDIFAQILQAAVNIPVSVKKELGHQTCESMAYFLKTSADSLFELYNLLKITLNLNLISIDEYHHLIMNLNEIGGIVQKLVTKFKSIQNDSGKNLPLESEDYGFWTLN